MTTITLKIKDILGEIEFIDVTYKNEDDNLETIEKQICPSSFVRISHPSLDTKIKELDIDIPIILEHIFKYEKYTLWRHVHTNHFHGEGGNDVYVTNSETNTNMTITRDNLVKNFAIHVGSAGNIILIKNETRYKIMFDRIFTDRTHNNDDLNYPDLIYDSDSDFKK